MNPRKARIEVAEVSERLWRRGWVANHDGNVSLRWAAGDRFFITPTAVSKRLCGPDALVECDLEGRTIGRGKPPSELALHLGAYRSRPDVHAVVHAHPPHVSAFALTNAELGPIAMPEVVVSLGPVVPRVALFLPKDPAVTEAIAAALALADVAILAGNGAIAVGPDLETAYLRMELLEHYAKILTIARGGAGTPVALAKDVVDRLLDMRRAAGLSRPGAHVSPAARDPGGALDAIVREEVRKALGGSR